MIIVLKNQSVQLSMNENKSPAPLASRLPQAYSAEGSMNVPALSYFRCHRPTPNNLALPLCHGLCHEDRRGNDTLLPALL